MSGDFKTIHIATGTESRVIWKEIRALVYGNWAVHVDDDAPVSPDILRDTNARDGIEGTGEWFDVTYVPMGRSLRSVYCKPLTMFEAVQLAEHLHERFPVSLPVDDSGLIWGYELILDAVVAEAWDGDL